MNRRWTVKHTRTFYRELARLPERIRARIEEIAFGEVIRENPFLAGRVENLKGIVITIKFDLGYIVSGYSLTRQTRRLSFGEFCIDGIFIVISHDRLNRNKRVIL